MLYIAWRDIWASCSQAKAELFLLSKGSAATEKDASFWPAEREDERLKEDSAASWSSGTLSDGIVQVMHSGLSLWAWEFIFVEKSVQVLSFAEACNAGEL